jgi:hypothetical protein
MVLMLIILAGTVDLGRLFLTYITMRDAAEEGVFYGSINPSHCHQVEDRVRANVSNPDVINITVTVNGVDCYSADPNTEACMAFQPRDDNILEVIVTDPTYKVTMPFLGTFIGHNTITLVAQANGQILRPACQ